MRHFTVPTFWDEYNKLRTEIRELADRCYELLFPIEIYSDERIAEFDAAEDESRKLFERKGLRHRAGASRERGCGGRRELRRPHPSA